LKGAVIQAASKTLGRCREGLTELEPKHSSSNSKEKESILAVCIDQNRSSQDWIQENKNNGEVRNKKNR
jgi:hypothetical protein